MSSIWSPTQLTGAAPLSDWKAFGTMPRGNFRSRFGATGEGVGWAATQTEVPDQMEEEPEVDLVEQASQEGFVAGFHEGERLTREAMEADDTARLTLAAAITQISSAGEGTLAALLSQAVLRLVTQIVGEVPVDEAVLAERCAAIAQHIDADDKKAVLEVNPLDLPFIDASTIAVSLAPNAELSRGSVRLSTMDGWIEDGPDVRLDRLKAMMDDMEGKL